DEPKLALLLAAIDPAIGGVLLRGQKGSAKTTLARGLAALLPGDAPFVDLPLGATEDRLVGTLDLGAVLTGEGRRFEPGLLAVARRHAPAEQELVARLARTRSAQVPDALVVQIGALCAAAGVDGLRADLVISRGAAALAGWDGRDEATAGDVRRVAPMALAHRQRRTPFDEPRENRLDDALDALDQPDDADD